MWKSLFSYAWDGLIELQEKKILPFVPYDQTNFRSIFALILFESSLENSI